MKKKFKGFTLAEVLITLMIIGVVAAITVPVLFANYKTRERVTMLKKTYSTLVQADKLAKANYDFGFAEAKQKCGTDPAKDNPEKDQTICAIINATIPGAVYMTKPSDYYKDGINLLYNSTTGDDDVTFSHLAPEEMDYMVSNGMSYGWLFPNGSALLIEVSDSEDTCSNKNPCGFVIDTNGGKGPNKASYCKQNHEQVYVGDPQYNMDTGIITYSNTCIVPNDTNHIVDLYEFYINKNGFLPASNATANVLEK